MKHIVTLFALFALVSCAGMQKPDAKDAKAVLDHAIQVCAFRDSLPAEAKPVCEKLDEAQRAARDAAKAVLEAVPEVK
jgi:hypothetical protein